jgi:hypothetical protein
MVALTTVLGLRWALGSGQPSPAVRPSLPPGVAYVEADASALTWRSWTLLTPTIRPPTSTNGRRRILVYVRLPVGPRITRSPDGYLTLPTGTDAVRVELEADTDEPDAPVSERWEVLDVRGTRMFGEGVEYTMLRPLASRPALLGFAWNPSRADPRDAAADLVRSGLLRGGSDEAAALHLRGINDCAGCHQKRRPEATTGPVHRGTDDQGFFGLRSVFEDEGPTETYRPRDANAGDPFIARLPGGRARLDMKAALAARDPHALRVCASRAALSLYFDDEARIAFRAPLRACDAP